MSDDRNINDENTEYSETETDTAVTAREKRLVARREARAAMPATFVDTWSTVIWPGHMRLVLGEWLYGGPQYRAAFVMELDEVERLANELLERVQRQRDKDAEKRKATSMTPPT
jgi:hypothetical protein